MDGKISSPSGTALFIFVEEEEGEAQRGALYRGVESPHKQRNTYLRHCSEGQR